MRIVSNLSLNYRRSRKSRSGQLPLDDLLGPAEPSRVDAGAGGSDWMAQSGDPLDLLEELGFDVEPLVAERAFSWYRNNRMR